MTLPLPSLAESIRLHLFLLKRAEREKRERDTESDRERESASAREREGERERERAREGETNSTLSPGGERVIILSLSGRPALSTTRRAGALSSLAALRFSSNGKGNQ